MCEVGGRRDHSRGLRIVGFALLLLEEIDGLACGPRERGYVLEPSLMLVVLPPDDVPLTRPGGSGESGLRHARFVPRLPDQLALRLHTADNDMPLTTCQEHMSQLPLRTGVLPVQCSFDMPRPSAADLIERLRDVYEQREGVKLADEKLAGRLPISLSTFNRWKKGNTASFDRIVECLDIAGWLSTPEDDRVLVAPPGDRLEALLVGQTEMAETLEEILARLPVPVEASPAQRRDAPKRRAK